MSPAHKPRKKIVNPQSDDLLKVSTPSSTRLWLLEPGFVVEEVRMKDGMEGGFGRDLKRDFLTNVPITAGVPAILAYLTPGYFASQGTKKSF